jgi:prevent-host-death family protein
MMTMVMMRTMAAAAFKAQCLRVMEDVRRRRQPVVITKRGKPVAKLVPVEERPFEILGCMAGKIEIVGDILAPATPAEAWEILGR